jgi:hypothetical protein
MALPLVTYRDVIIHHILIHVPLVIFGLVVFVHAQLRRKLGIVAVDLLIITLDIFVLFFLLVRLSLLTVTGGITLLLGVKLILLGSTDNEMKVK